MNTRLLLQSIQHGLHSPLIEAKQTRLGIDFFHVLG